MFAALVRASRHRVGSAISMVATRPGASLDRITRPTTLLTPRFAPFAARLPLRPLTALTAPRPYALQRIAHPALLTGRSTHVQPRPMVWTPTTRSMAFLSLPGGGGSRYRRFGQSSGGAWAWGSRRTNIALGVAAVFGVVCAVNVEVVPFTDRKRVNLLPRNTELQMGRSGYQTMLSQNRSKILPPTHPQHVLVRAIAEDIIRGNTHVATLKGVQWEFAVIQNPTPNAMVFPGGKVVVYTGLLDLLRGHEVADLCSVVLAHEIGHTVAQHTAEKLTKTLILTWPVILALSSVLDSGYFASRIAQLFVDLPFSRKFESEADRIGIELLANAGLPTFVKAPELFRRLADRKKGREPGEWASTHPSDSTRIKQLEKWIPEVIDKYAAKLPPQVVGARAAIAKRVAQSPTEPTLTIADAQPKPAPPTTTTSTSAGSGVFGRRRDGMGEQRRSPSAAGSGSGSSPGAVAPEFPPPHRPASAPAKPKAAPKRNGDEDDEWL